jgi:hypothetical protein
MSDGGKGSGRRPQAVSDEQVADNWSAIFGIGPLERKRRQEALDEMVRISEELGLYDEPQLPETEKPTTGSA